MPLTVSQGFTVFLERLTPLESHRQAATKHRGTVETALKKSLTVNSIRETGSFSHGTGVRNYSDVDVLVSLGHAKPASPDTALGWVKSALQKSFPTTTVRISKPAVVVEFAAGKETWEVIPGFATNKGDKDYVVYDIPGVGSAWLDSAPAAHLEYVTSINGTTGIKGGAKALSRLVKAWKYYNNVPVSSFYLEMRAAKYMSTEKSFVASNDIEGLLSQLWDIQLASMNDPQGYVGRFYACSTEAKGKDALSKLDSARKRAEKALLAESKGNLDDAFYYWDLCFGGHFPAR